VRILLLFAVAHGIERDVREAILNPVRPIEARIYSLPDKKLVY
jgi:hypothetical protein